MRDSRVDAPGSNRRLVWLVGLAAAALAVLAAWFIVDTVRMLGSLRHERTGAVSVTACSFVAYGQRGDTYSCSGVFTANDAELQPRSVTFDHTGDLDPGTRMAASVSAPDDTTATIGGTRSLVIGIVLAVASVAGLATILLRFRRLTRTAH